MSLKIALIGQAAFAEKVLEGLHNRHHRIVRVFAPPDSAAGRPDPLKAKALELCLPTSQPASFKSDATYEQFKALDADLAILAFVTVIVPERILYLPRLKSICFHPSLLPRHRGASAISWTIIQGDTETGVTVFWPDKGIDTGPILLQKRAPIAETDTAGSLYFNRLFSLGVETVLESVELIDGGQAPAIPQDESQATYEPPCRDQHARVDFHKSAREVYNLVRGCDPQPGAYADLGGRKLRLYEPSLSSAARSQSGEITSIDSSGMRIGLADGVLEVKRVRLEPEGKKVAALDLKSSGHLREGQILS